MKIYTFNKYLKNSYKFLTRSLGSLKYDEPYLKLTYDDEFGLEQKYLMFIKPNYSIKKVISNISEVYKSGNKICFKTADGFTLHDYCPFRTLLDGNQYLFCMSEANKRIELVVENNLNLRNEDIKTMKYDKNGPDKTVNEMNSRLERVNAELSIFEQQKEVLSMKAEKRAELMMLGVVTLMGIQSGFLGYLTFVEFSWDMMEPITYFITYTANIYALVYYILTKKEYNSTEINEREYLKSLIKYSKENKLNIDRYIALKDEANYLARRLEDYNWKNKIDYV